MVVTNNDALYEKLCLLFDGEEASKKLSITEDVAAREVTLPLYPAMTDEQALLVVEAIQHSLASISGGSLLLAE